MSNVPNYQSLDVMTAPLDGVNLVEANAGTGKTYNIVSLYLRLLLESPTTVDRILVVSFTEAATAELRERVRTRLRKLQLVFETGNGDDEDKPFLQCCADRKTGLQQIVRALQSFDQAAIYTIHGFCQRLLTDSAFEAGISQTTELITDDDALRRQLIGDFWHTETTAASSLWAGYLLDYSDPEKLYKLLAKYFSRPLIRRLAPADSDAGAGLEEQFAGAFSRLQQDWRTHRQEIDDLLRNDSGLSRVRYGSKTLDKLLRAADDWIYAGGVSVRALAKLEKLGSKTINASVNKGGFSPPQHPVFDLFQQLLDLGAQLEPIFAQRLGAMRRRLLEFANRELPRRKQERRVRHFDDLLSELYSALRSEQAHTLRQAAARQYSAALIDEFQDTDPLQFAIFDSLFCRNATPVFFVGDPKQAIYGFRGADVYAYLDARSAAEHRFRLDLNYRSAPRLIDSVNRLFQQRANPFVISDIGFQPSGAARDKPGLIIDGDVQATLRWWQIADDDIQTLKKSDIEKKIAESVAMKIADLLRLMHQGRVSHPDNKPLQAGDIAVLVNSHAQGRLVRDALGRRGVMCKQRTEDNVFQSIEANELYIVLRAVVEPSRYPLVRAALATELLGYNGSQIDALEQADRKWQDLLDRFAEYHDIWRQYDFSRMYRRILQDFSVARRLLRLPDGQRRVTNLLHLADLLQRESSRRRGSLDEVLIWMREQEQVLRASDQAMLLRLESDEDLVSIMTVHFSKGLQFPVVFCPYLWTVFTPRQPPLPEFHDDENRATVDLNCDGKSVHKAQVEMEQLAERVRLSYVALTRAELACWVVWGAMPDTERSGLNWLLGPSSNETGPGGRAAQASLEVQQLRLPSGSEIASTLKSLSSDAMTAETMPEPSIAGTTVRQTRSTRLNRRVLQRDVPRGWRVSSFSALTRHAAEEPRDYDAGKSEDKAVAVEPQGIFAFPRGARAGRCIHALLENIEFDAARVDIEAVARQVLTTHGFDVEQAPVLADMAWNVMHTGLDSKSTIRLGDVPPDRRVVEMEFYFPIAGLNADALRAALGRFGHDTPVEQRLAQLDFRIGGGFMHGFVDLIFEADGRFYVVDYKSNWLGNENRDYRVDSLQQEISKHDYYLQYLIYSVALHRYLAGRLSGYDYERHFGGAYYLFVRGMHPEDGAKSGVFYDRPDRELMQRLDNVFGQTGRPQ